LPFLPPFILNPLQNPYSVLLLYLNMKKLILLLFLLPTIAFGQVADIDGNVYQTVVIGAQEWMAENLRTTKYANGDFIPNVTNANQWSNLTTGAWCHNSNDSLYETIYGKLYNWYTVDDSRNVCPMGWHVPTDGGWTTLTDYLGGGVAGGKMKDVGTTQAGTGLWRSPNTGATNSSGFTGLPGGTRSTDGSFAAIVERYGYWWSSTENFTSYAFYRKLGKDYGHVVRSSLHKDDGFSVRCLNKTLIDTTATTITEPPTKPKELLTITDLLGRTTHPTPNTLLFYIYDDGSVEKRVQLDR